MRLPLSNTAFFIVHDGAPPEPADSYLGPLTTPKAIDVAAALFGRVLTWQAELVFSASGTWSAGANSAHWSTSGSASFTVATVLLSGTPLDTEGRLANPFDCLLLSGGGDLGTGNMTGTYNGAAQPSVPVTISAGIATANGNYGHPELGTESSLLTLVERCQKTPSGLFVPFVAGWGNLTDTPVLPGIGAKFDFGTNLADDAPHAGFVTITVPDWMEDWYPGIYPGASSVTMPIAAVQFDFSPGDTVTFAASAALTLTPLTCLPYGLDPDDPLALTTEERIWNDDGSALRDPLNP